MAVRDATPVSFCCLSHLLPRLYLHDLITKPNLPDFIRPHSPLSVHSNCSSVSVQTYESLADTVLCSFCAQRFSSTSPTRIPYRCHMPGTTTYRSLNAIVAQPENCPFRVYNTIQLKNITTKSENNGNQRRMFQLPSVPYCRMLL